MSDVWTDGKGIRYSKPNCPRIELPWTKVVKYYDALAESGQLIPPKEASRQNHPQEITSEASVETQPETAETLPAETAELSSKESAPAEWAYNEIKSAHPDDIVLFQVGDFFEMYGEDARQAAKLLELTLATRPVPGAGRVAMCGIPAHHLEQYTEKLREQFDVTIAAIPETDTERRIFTLRSVDHEAEAAINAQEAEFGADGTRVFHAPDADLPQPTVQDYLDRYTPVVMTAVSEDTAYRNACGHTDRENAQIECNAAVRRAVLQMKNTELLKPFLDMPEFRSRLHGEVFDGTYAQLHELLRPLSQDDIDDALRRWNGDIASKRAVYRHMSTHGRESDTAAWLEQEFSAEKKPFIVRPGSPESYEMPWTKVQRRIAQLIRTEKFYTEEEQDRLDDIDPIAIRERLAESGIIDGKVVDPEKLNNNPFIRMVTEDVQRISDEEFAKEHLIPGESTFEIDGRTFLVDRVNLDSCSVNFQDITFSNATGFPIFRTESIAFIRKYVEEQEKQSVQPVTSAETVAVYPGEKNNLPYDVVVQTLRTEGTPPPIQNTPVSIPIDEKWQEFPSVADAEQASYEEYKENLRRNARNFRITDDGLGTGGPKAKFQANMAAIRLLKNLEQEGLQASPEQQEILSRYVGWGGLPDAFDDSKSGWASEYQELKATLTPTEYEAARASTLNAHYTSPTVIRAIYEAVGNMGFQTGNILEPSMGVGNFFGMLPEEMQSSCLYGVELDSISGRIARQLYPNANITIGGFETTERKDFFDLAIGNVPFGQYKVNDPAYNKLGFNIHNYFFAKALDQVRPGGIVAFVTSRYTLDAQNPNVRKYLAQRAELLGAIRLPNTAFKANAGTEVVSDILFLQKRERALDLEPEWVHLGQTEDGFAINSYFLEHPEMVMGKNSSESTAHGIDYTVEPLEDVSLAQQLHEAVQHIQGSYLEAELPDLGDGDVIQNTIPADPDVKNYSYALVDGEVYFRENSVMVRPELSNVAKERVKGMIGLRDCVRALIDLQMNYLTPDADIREKQADLNSLYDGFSKKYGLINSKGNRMAFSDDSSYYLLCSLEVLDEDNKFFRKADMFTKRTIRQAHAVTSVDTASEALAVSIAEHACVDMDYMSQLSGKYAADLAAELRGVIFQVPDFSENSIPHYVTADLCVDNVLRIWREGAADKLTQLIFCDISTPKSQAPVRKTLPEQSDFPSTQSADPLAALNSSDSSFTVYDDIRGKLIAGGIPEEQIAFIHEANTEARKKELFAKVRTGQVRVLMGSTFKMGAGMNVQDRLIALHDLDCPWRPGDLEQRSGRIIRQGNRNKQVHIYRYVTEGTFDSYLWQTVENKQKFISQIMTSKSPVRSCDDVDETALSFAEIKALCAGNPQIKEKMDLDIEVSRLKVLKADHLSQQFRMEDNLLKYFPEQIQKLQSIIAGLEADIHLVESHPHPEDGISPIVIDGNALSDKEAVGTALLDAVNKATGLEPVSIGTYRGFQITATLENFGKDRILTLSSALSHQVTLGNDARGNLIRIDNALRELPQQLTTSKNQLENLQSQMEFTKAELGKPFPQEAELAQKSQRLREKADTTAFEFDRIAKDFKAAEQRLVEIAALKKHIVNYAKTRDAYIAYRKAGYSKTFFEAHREEITLHKAAKDAFEKMNVSKLPKVKALSEEYASTLTQKKALYAQYRLAREQMQEYQKALHNTEVFFELSEKEAACHQREHEKENSEEPNHS